METKNVLINNMTQSKELVESCIQSTEFASSFAKLSNLLIQTYKNQKNVFVCGNGGSHCDAMHFCEELTGRFQKDRPALGALALGDSSHVTCVGNDFGFDSIFSRQIEGLGKPGDLLIGITTSGNSKNIIKAVESAKSMGLKTAALLGRDGGELLNLVDCPVLVKTPKESFSDRIQEVHIQIIHSLIEAIERQLYPQNFA